VRHSAQPIRRFLRPWISLGMLLGLLAPSLAGAVYQCRESGELRKAPCSQAERAHPSIAGNCCAHDAPAPATPMAAAPTTDECCRTIDPDASILPPGVVPVEPPTLFALLPIEVPGWDHAPVLESPSVSRAPPRPPGDVPPFLLQCRFLC
jgi:hypothetical protein